MSHLNVASSSEEIEDEIIFTQTLIDSLDPASEHYARECHHLSETLQYLESLLQQKNAVTDQSLAHGGQSTRWGNNTNSYQYPVRDSGGYDNQVATFHDDSSTTSTPGGFSNGHLKRPREPSFGDASMAYENKSRRTTPDSGLDTPTSIESLEQMQRGFENGHGPAFPRSSSQHALDRRRRLEKEAYERAVQQRRDNEMAKALEEANRNMPNLGLGAGSASYSTWTGPKESDSLNAYSQFSGIGMPALKLNTQGGAHDTSSPPSLPPLKPDENTLQSNRYDRPLAYLPSPNNAVSSSSNPFTEQGPTLKTEQPSSGSAMGSNGGIAEIVDLTGNSSEEENASTNAVSSYSLGPGNAYGATQYPEYYSNDPFADLVPHQNYLLERAQAMPGADQESAGTWSQAYNNFTNGIQNFGQAVGDLATSLNPFGRQAVGMPSGPAGYSSYGDSSGLFNDLSGYNNGYGAAGPSNPLVGDAMDDYLRNRGVNHDFDYLYSDPTKTREEINDLLRNISADEDLPPELRGDTPEPMKTTLMPHQLLGLRWLTKMEESTNAGGILADDMGLGKTIQALALMVTHRSSDKLRKTTLIIAPVALLRQWKREIEEKIKPAHKLSVFIFHGQHANMTHNRLRQYDVVLTTFGKLGTELKKQRKYEFRLTSDSSALRRRDEEVCLIGDDCRWFRVIIDEAQCIKNRTTQVAQAACKLHAKYRLCMTGTPMMNNVEELYSLIRFLRIKPYCHWEDFRKDFVKPLKDPYKITKDRAMKKLQALLKAILLRRTKTSKIDGQPIIRIPERSVEDAHAVFGEDEQQVYHALEQNSQLTFNKYLKAGTVGKNYSNMLTLLLRLRQCCCHPHLMRDWSVTAEQVSDNPDRMPELAKKLAPDVVQRIKDADGNFECPVCYDAVENPAIFFPCGHDTCLDCFANISDPARAIREGDENGAAKCPQCRGPIKRSDLLDYKTFRKVHMPETVTEEEENRVVADEEDDSDSDSDDSDDDSGDDVDNRGNLKDFVVDDDEEEAEETDIEDDEAESSSRAKQRPAKKKAGRPKKDKKGKGKEKQQNKTKTLAELKKLSMRNQKAKRKYLKKLKKDFVTSSKIDKTLDILKHIRENDPREKTIIFSQWTSLLDLLEIAFDKEQPGLGCAFTRYDGSMNANARNDAVNSFLDRPNVKIMLVSLKAGNAGLNLTAASQVIILDPFWNPFIEEQAIDRAHRIGQQRSVRVHKVLVEGTVEDRIVALQEKKRELIQTALDEGESKKLGRLSTGELAYLFGVSHNPNAN